MFKFILVTMLFMGQGYALDFYNYKDNQVTRDYSTAQVNNAWNNDAACIKDGSKIVAVNKKFKEMKLGYRDCSNGKSATAKHAKLGINVTVLKAEYLPKAIFDQVMKR